MSARIRVGLFAVLSVVIVFSAAAIGNMATMPSIPTWYATLNKPFFNPPNWIFGPVWTLLYSLLAFSFWRILKSNASGSDRTHAMGAFTAQMILNPLWSIVFFYFHAPAFALVIVILLELSVLNMIRVFARIDRTAANLQWPYAAWVAFATLLNAAIVGLN
jgi:tryptophan-rich sensory protein